MAQTIVITGASSGVGTAAARRLHAEGHNVVVVGRDSRRTNQIADEIDAERFVADYSSLDDVRQLATQLNSLDHIDVLMNNAGGMFAERTVTHDGFETSLQVNHLAPFLLTHLLSDSLHRGGASIIQTASVAHYRGRLNIDDLGLTKGWSPWRAYCNAKLMNVLFTQGLNSHFTLEGVYPASFHPGVVSSNFGGIGGVTGWYYGSRIGKATMISPEKGADTGCWLATSNPPRDWAPGGYYAKRR